MPTVCQFCYGWAAPVLTFAAWRTQSQKGAVQNIGPVQQHPLQFALRNLRCLSPWPHVYIVMNGPRTCFRPWLLCVEIRLAGVRKLTSKLSRIYVRKGQLINLYLSTLNANKRRRTLYFILQDISTGNGCQKGGVIRLLSRKKECTHTHVAYIHNHLQCNNVYITTMNSSKNMTSQVTGTSSLRTDFLDVAEPQITMRLS